jgi:homoserine O-acetyltransferase
MPHGAAFPDITTGDMVAAQSRLLDYLGVARMAAVIGYSYGGYLAFTWGFTHPARMRALVPVATGISGRGGSETVIALQDRFAAQCPGWHGGQYYDAKKESGVEDALAAIRIETLRGYGIERGLAAQYEDAARARRALDEMAREWAREFDANSLIALRKAAIRYDARPHVGSIDAPLLYVLSRTDALFPPKLAMPTLELLRKAGVDAHYVEIDSEHGHRGPSVDWRLWAGPLRSFLDEHAR